MEQEVFKSPPLGKRGLQFLIIGILFGAAIAAGVSYIIQKTSNVLDCCTYEDGDLTLPESEREGGAFFTDNEEAVRQHKLYVNQLLQKHGKTKLEDIDDNTEVTFRLDRLEDYLCYAEQVADSYEDVGIRIYFGAKEGSNPIEPPTNTLFLTVVKRNSSGDYEVVPGSKPFNYGSSRRPPPDY